MNIINYAVAFTTSVAGVLSSSDYASPSWTLEIGNPCSVKNAHFPNCPEVAVFRLLFLSNKTKYTQFAIVQNKEKPQIIQIEKLELLKSFLLEKLLKQ